MLYCRYWGEAKKNASGITLEQLHERALRRAQEKKRASGKCEERPGEERNHKATAINEGDSFKGSAEVTPAATTTESTSDEGVREDEEAEELADVREDAAETERATMEEERGFDVLGGRSETERAAVHRHMPDWIAHPYPVETDIKSHSKPITEFSLPELVLKNLQNMGVSQLFPVQSHVIPHLRKATAVAQMTGVAPSDLLVCAPTGCGKTLCYVVPLACALLEFHVCKLRAIVVLPTADVAAQVHQVFKQVLNSTRIAVELICGQCSCDRESKAMRSASVIVTTPGRLVEHLQISSLPSLSHLRFLVVDEADRLLDRAHQGWLRTLLDAVYNNERHHGAANHVPQSGALSLTGAPPAVLHYPHRTPAVTTNVISMMHPALPLQKLLFSATLSYSPEHLAVLALHRPVLYSTSGEADEAGGSSLPDQLREFIVPCSPGDKPLVLLHLVLTLEKGRVLCFTNSLETTHRLHLLMEQMKRVSSVEVSGAMSKGKRNNILHQFRSGQVQLLICSDSLARGMDFAGVACVINYNSPLHFNTYLHRAGRTGRAGEEGTVYSILSGAEVYPFQSMMASAKRAKVKKLKIAPHDLEVYKEEYVKALEALKDLVADDE